jgi:hypothetical protein
MALGGIEGALSTIAACGGVGVFIDFWIGKRGEKHVKDWLETWWLRFSYVDARNFGREEAVFAVATMDRLLGQRFFSGKRFILFAMLLVLDAAIWSGWGAFGGLELDAMSFREKLIAIPVGGVFVGFLTFSLSIKLTRSASMRAVGIASKWPALTGVVFLTLLLIQYAIMLVWSWLASWDPHKGFPQFGLLPDIRSEDLMWIFTNGGRFGLAVLFVGSYLLKPLHRTISTLWARVVESENPIFTLLLGGGAAVAKAIEVVIHAL